MADNQVVVSEERLVQALEIVYNPRSKNEDRQAATVYLDNAKMSPDALATGFLLASDSQRQPILRHYGLSMMLFHLKYVYKGGNVAELREYVMRLTASLTDSDPSYLRNKIVSIWTDVAKRTWGLGWNNMDEQLVKLWESSLAHKEFVMLILETLSEDITREEYVAALRPDLGAAFTTICLAEDSIDATHRVDDTGDLRFGKDGWLQRICDGLRYFLQQRSQQPNNQLQACVIRSLMALQVICSWISTKAMVSSQCVHVVWLAFAAGDTAARMAALDVLYSIYSRHNMETADIEQFVQPLFSQESLQLLHDAYSWAKTASPDGDDEKYAFAKKLSEVLACLGTLIEHNPQPLESTGNLSPFFALVLEISTHPSMLVSLPLLDVWLRLLRSKSPQFTDVINESMPTLLDTCTQRSIKFDSFPEDPSNQTMAFLLVDCDTTAQRELILQQYRAACVHIIEAVVRRVPLDAINYILEKAAAFYTELSARPFNAENYTKPSLESLQADAHFSAVEAGARGCLKWLATHSEAPVEEHNKAVERKGIDIEDAFARWCSNALDIPFQDPDIKKKMVAQSVSLSSKILSSYPNTALVVLNNLLSIRSVQCNSSQQYKDMTKELLETCAYGAQRLATAFADDFLKIYDQLETRIGQIITDEGSDLEPRWVPFLVMIIHRASNLDTETRTEKLRKMIAGVKEQWENPALHESLKDFDSFCRFLGWDQLPEFLHSGNFAKVQDWSDVQLEEKGLALQTNLLNRNDQIPIRMTKALLHATTEKLEEGSPIFAISCAVWGEIMPVILPNLLKMLSYATSFHNSERWSIFPPDIQVVIRRILTDRFWQNGISAESRDAFVSKVNNTKNTYEGFGSTVRRTVRQIRTGACDLLLFFSKLGEVFYSIPDMAVPVSEALYDGSASLSPHHFSVLITFSSTLIKGCPVHLRGSFLPPILANLFSQLRIKVDNEWDILNHRTEHNSEEDNLDDEMKNQSILRSMTYNGCYLLFYLTNPDNFKGEDPSPLSLITTNGSILEPVLTFTASALRVRDYHSVKSTSLVLHNRLVPLYREPNAVHDYICNDILKAAISSLHEPYFVDLQRELASLIVQIITLDASISATVLCSLPGLSKQPEKVATAIERVRACTTDRIGRALVLELLENIRGVSIHEMGRIGGPKKSRTQARLLQQFESQVESEANARVATRGESPSLDGVAQLLQ